MESLLSFGLYVERITDLNVPCNIPAVGFRFLDYPTVVINCNSSENNKNITKNINIPLDIGDEDGNTNILNAEEGGFRFGKGKSCLFKNNLESLGKLLKEIPLYVMVFDSTIQTSKLIGCCSIPLMNLLNQIKQQMKLLGPDSPAAGEESGEFIIYNLMGVQTGKIKLVLKLNFYGSSLMKYKYADEKDAPIDLSLNLQRNESLHNSVKKPERLIDSVIHSVESIKLNLDVMPEEKASQCNFIDYENRHHVEDEVDDYFDTYCPPPLFLNVHEKRKHASKRMQSGSQRLHTRDPSGSFQSSRNKSRSKQTSVNNASSDEEPYIEKLQPVGNRVDICNISKKVESNLNINNNIVTKENHQYPNGEVHAISKLPLLSALSAEIIKLVNFIDKVKENGEYSNLLDENKTSHRLSKQRETDLNVPNRINVNNEVDNVTDIRIPVDKDVNNNLDGDQRISKITKKKHPENRTENNVKMKKGKLKYKSTRTQKLRYQLMKQNKQNMDNNMKAQKANDDQPEIDDIYIDQLNDDVYIDLLHDVKDLDELNRNPLEMIPEGGGLMKEKIQIDDRNVAKEETEIVVGTSFTQIVETKPGFYTPTSPSKIGSSELGEIVGQNRRSLSRNTRKLESRSKSRRTESRTGPHRTKSSIESRRVKSSIESRLTKSRSSEFCRTESRRSNKSYKYADDTFSSEDGSAISRTSSVSIPLSNLSENSLSPQSNIESESESESRGTRNELRHDTEEPSSRLSRNASRHSDESDLGGTRNVSRPCSNVSGLHSNASGKHSNASGKYSNVSGKHSNASGKLSNASGKHSNASHLSSVKLQRYVGRISSNSSQKSLDKLYDRTESQLSGDVNVLPQNDSLASDIQGITPHDENNKDNPTVSEYSPRNYKRSQRSPDYLKKVEERSVSQPYGGDTHKSINISSNDFSGVIADKNVENDPNSEKNLSHKSSSSHDSRTRSFEKSNDRPASHVSSDNSIRNERSKMGANKSAYFPRKSKNSEHAPQVRPTKKLEYRADSALSGDNTMNEIDAFIGECTGSSNFSSAVIPTDEISLVSPYGSAFTASMPEYSNENSPTRTLSRLDNKSAPYVPQFGTLEEVNVALSNESSISASSDKNVGNHPKLSVFSPHQSKQFLEKKNVGNILGENKPFSNAEQILHENVPSFSTSKSNPYESSFDSGY